MPISYNPTTQMITVTYVAGDPKGNAFATPWTIDDVYQADLAGGWGVVTKTGGQQYSFSAILQILGNTTYFWARDCVVEWYYPGNSASIIVLQVASGANFNSGVDHVNTGNREMIWRIFYPQGGTKYLSISGNSIGVYNSIFIGFPVCGFSGVEGSNAKIYRCLFIRCGYVLRGNQYAEYEDNTVIAGNYGITPLEPFQKFNRNTLLRQNLPILQNASGTTPRYFRYEGLRIFDCVGNDITSQVRHFAINDFVDCNVGKTINFYGGSSAQNGEVEWNWLSTFEIKITNELGDLVIAQVKITDKDDQEVYNDTGSELTTEVKYYKAIATWTGATLTLTKSQEAREPFKIEVQAPGYQKTTMPDIFINEGNKTIIKIPLKEVPIPTVKISGLLITPCSIPGASDGKIEFTAQDGTAPYQYSIGSGFGPQNEFTDLPEGEYIIQVKDADDITATLTGVKLTAGSQTYYVDNHISGILKNQTISGNLQKEAELTNEAIQEAIQGEIKPEKKITGKLRSQVLTGTI